MSEETAALRILIVDYGMGNIRSIHNAFARIGCSPRTSDDPAALLEADALILPGVGAFGEAVANLKARGLIDPIRDAVEKDGMPLLGICLGMQLLAESSEEGVACKGLSLIPGDVRRITVSAGLRLPHVGWNSLHLRSPAPLFSEIADGDSFYFVHSYHFLTNSDYIAATTDYGGEVVAAVQHGRVFGVQFHPERSQSKGLALLRNFAAHVKLLKATGDRQC